MNCGHSEKGREFCIRTETRLIDRDCRAHTRQPDPHSPSNLPLVKGSLVHQVGGMVGAGEGVVHRLVLHDHRAVIGNNVAVEVVDGGLVLEKGKRQLGWACTPMMMRRILKRAIGDSSDKSPLGRYECLPLRIASTLFVWVG